MAAKLARRCCIQISYAIGRAQPLSISIETYGTATIAYEDLERVVHQNFDMRPGVVAQDLHLMEPIFAQTSRNGHFSDQTWQWEQPKALVIDLRGF